MNENVLNDGKLASVSFESENIGCDAFLRLLLQNSSIIVHDIFKTFVRDLIPLDCDLDFLSTQRLILMRFIN